MSTYAISDIHGCYDEFIAVLSQAGFGNNDELFILGDIIDRGPKVDSCLQWLARHKANSDGSNIHFLMGNHEQMMLWGMESPWNAVTVSLDSGGAWLRNGGDATIEQISQALNSGKLTESDIDFFEHLVNNAPKALTTVRTDGTLVLMCHAGIRPPETDNPYSDEWLYQTEDDLLWLDMSWYTSAKNPDFHVISGHVPTSIISQWKLPGCPRDVYLYGTLDRIMNWEKKHAIDCGGCFGGNIGLLRIDDWKEFHVPVTSK